VPARYLFRPMQELSARTGRTRTGLPVSLNVAPPPDLEPFVARFFVTIIDQPDEQVVEDILLNETALVRVLVRGDWDMWVPQRGWRRRAGALLFGAQRRAMRVRARGPMAVAGFAIRPGGWFGLEVRDHRLLADRVDDLDGPWGASLVAAAADIDDHGETIARLVAACRARVADLAGAADPVAAMFERIARDDPTVHVCTVADRLALTPRALEHRIRRHFGHVPKLVLRRSRFLDMAAVMRGLAMPDEETLAGLRFYDASHLNREFRLFVDMTPAAFARATTPLMTPGLEVRQQRKLQDAGAPGPAPWLG
jgi:AraC-like DNA-binding protein